MFIRNNFRGPFQKLKILALGLVMAGCTCAVSASQITNAYAAAYSAQLYCLTEFHDQTDTLMLNLSGAAGGGEILGVIQTDDTTDPTLTLHHIINNTTGIAWNGYSVSVFMPNPFVIETAGIFAPAVLAPAGWTVSVTPPGAVVGGFQGSVNMSWGPGMIPVLPGETLEFKFSITFADGLGYSFTENAAPGLVPEPSTAALLLAGLVAFGLRKYRKA